MGITCREKMKTHFVFCVQNPDRMFFKVCFWRGASVQWNGRVRILIIRTKMQATLFATVGDAPFRRFNADHPPSPPLKIVRIIPNLEIAKGRVPVGLDAPTYVRY